MQSGLLRTICQMGIFMICAQAIVHFRPKASYEKYLKMLVSIMILIQLFMSVGEIFSSASGSQLAERAERFAESMEESMRRAAESALFPDEGQFRILGEKPVKKEEEEELERQQEEDSSQSISVQIAPIRSVQPIKIEVTRSGDGAQE